MNIVITNEKNVFTLALDGRLTITDAPEFHNEMDKVLRFAKEVVLDLEHLEYIASAGLREMLIAEKYMESKGGRIVLKNVNSMVRHVLDDTGINKVISIADD